MKRSLFFLILLFTFKSYSQELEWQKTYGGTDADEGMNVVAALDGGFFLIGSSLSDNIDLTGNNGDFDFWVVKASSDGEIEWQENLGGSKRDEAFDAVLSPDGGLVIVGSTESDNFDVTNHRGNADYWVVKLSSTGNLEWQKCFGGGGNDYGQSIDVNTEGGYYVAGYTSSNDGDVSGKHGTFDYWVIKIDQSGNLLWQKCLGGTNFDIGNSVYTTEDGGCIVLGDTVSSNGDVTDHIGNTDYWVVKLDSSGEIEWTKSLGGTNTDGGKSIIQLSDGNYAVCGLTTSTDVFVTENFGQYDFWIAKIDSQGELIWQKSLGGIDGDSATSIGENSEGHLFIAGYSASNDVIDNDGSTDFLIAELSDDGEIQWIKSFGGSNMEMAFGLTVLPNDDFMVVGYSDSVNGDLTNNLGGTDFWVLKFNGENMETIEENSTSFYVYPNPATAKLFFSEQLFNVTLFNETGQNIKTLESASELNISNLNNGIYILKAFTKDKKSVSHQFIKK